MCTMMGSSPKMVPSSTAGWLHEKENCLKLKKEVFAKPLLYMLKVYMQIINVVID